MKHVAIKDPYTDLVRTYRFAVYLDLHPGAIPRVIYVRTRKAVYHHAKKHYRQHRHHFTRAYTIVGIDLGPDEASAPSVLVTYGQPLKDLEHALLSYALATG